MTSADDLRDQRLYDEISQIANDLGALQRRSVRELARCKAELATMHTVLGAVAHDLRSPLTAVLGFAELLLGDEALTPVQRELSERVDRAARAMTSLTQELVAVVTAGSSPARSEPVEIAAVVRHVVARYQLLLPERGVLVHLDLGLGLETPEIVMGDEAQLERLVENLISNAVKFSPEDGEVRVCVSSDAGNVEIRVSDDGPGLPPEQLEEIFVPFHRAPEAASVPGIGLGLAIVKEMVERHGGRVHVESTLGAGATFVVRLPRTTRGLPGR